MAKFIIILISFLAIAWDAELKANECGSGDDLIVTAPKNGTKTLNPAVTIRGYLCRNYPIILIRNENTRVETFTETREVCDDSECAYHFAAPVRGLELGQNRITAEIPGEDLMVEIEVLRTALASSASCSESCPAGSWMAGL